MKKFEYLAELAEIVENCCSHCAAIEGNFCERVVAFFDLTGSTPLKMQCGHREAIVSALLHNGICRKVCKHFGGEAIKELGDGIIISFSNPINACYAMLNTRKALSNASIKSTIASTYGRVEVIKRDGKDDIFGSTVDRAARISSEIAPGQVILDSAFKTYIETFVKENKDLEFDECEEVLLRGIGPVKLFRLRVVGEPFSTGASTKERKRIGSKLNISRLSRTPGKWHSAIEDILLHDLEKKITSAAIGQIFLTPSKYYQLIHKEIVEADVDTEVYAVALNSLDKWVNNKQQVLYHEKNIASSKKGVKIRRIYICPTTIPAEVTEQITLQVRAGIEVRVTTSITRDLQDVVIFKNQDTQDLKAYIAYPDLDYPERLQEAMLLIDESLIANQIEKFNEIWEWATPFKEEVS